jgi:hypothetical protein
MPCCASELIREGGAFLRTVELGGTELGTLRTCAREARAREKRLSPSQLSVLLLQL